MTSLQKTLLVGAGGFVRANARFWLGAWLSPRLGGPGPTLVINLLGSLLLGILAGASRSEGARLFLGVGGLGGFTTFSAFSLEVLGLLEGREFGRAGVYAGASLALGITAAGVGLALGRLLAPRA